MANPGSEVTSDLDGLYRAHASGLLAFLCGRLGDPATAEDVLHDVFVTFCRLPNLAEIQNPRAYLYRSADRRSLSVIRDRHTQGRHQKEWSKWSATWRFVEDSDPLQAHALREALAELKGEERDVLILRVFGSQTFPEIAQILSRPLTSVFKCHTRAIASLSRTLKREPTKMRLQGL